MGRWHDRLSNNDRAARPGGPRRASLLLLALAFLASLIASLSHRQLLPLIPIALSLLVLHLAVPRRHADGLRGRRLVVSARRATLPALLAGLLVSGGSGWSISPVSATGGTPFVWTWGTSPLPVESGALTGVVAVEVGFSHRLAVANDGTVWAWGSGWVLADGTSDPVTTPAQVHGPGGAGVLSGITAVAGGGSYTLARAQDGTVWAWGNNLVGQLGTNGGETEATVARVVGPGGAGYLGSVTAVAAGIEHSLALRSDGTVWAWGYNGDYELGNTLGNSATPVQVGGLGGVTAIAGGDRYNLALRSDGTVWAWGRNDKGQLGNGTATPAQRATPAAVPGVANIVAIAAGASHALALAQDGTVWAWGDNLRGAIGDGATTSGIRAATHIVGSNGTGLLGGVTAIAAGTFSSQALLADGTVRSWGGGSRLGNGTTCSGTGCDRPYPVAVSTLTGVTAIAAGQVGALAIADPVAVGLSATSLTFPAQPVGTTGAAQAVTLTNTSAISVPLGTIVVVGDFDASGNCGGTTLAPGASCTLNVTFTPTEAGTRAGALTISSNVAGSPSVGLSGEGLSGSTPFAVLTPGQLSFPSVAVSQYSATQTATLRNDGGGDLHIAAISASGDFSATHSCPTTLAAGAECSIAVTFTPTAVGERTGQLVVTSDATGSPHAVALRGVGLGVPVLSFSINGATISGVQFGDQAIGSTSSVAQVVLITNVGTAPATLSSLATVGTDGEEFSVSANTCLSGIAVSASCTLGLVFHPTRGPEAVLRVARSGQLEIREATTSAPYSIGLSGRAAPPPLMYVHGIKSDFRTPTFGPIIGLSGLPAPSIGSLKHSLYSESAFANRLRLFEYYQDVGGGNITGSVTTGEDCSPGSPLPPAMNIPLPTIVDDRDICDSQSDLGIDAILLYADMEQLFNETGRQRKVIIICHSMGCGITRGFMAYAQELHSRDAARPSAEEMVDSVTFIQGAVSGSMLAKIGGAVDDTRYAGYCCTPSNGPGDVTSILVNEAFRSTMNSTLGFNLTRPAVTGLRPGSDYYEWARREYSSGYANVRYTPDLPYFAVYGDLRMVA